MISDEDLEQLRYKGEGADLDFKQAQYSFSGAPEGERVQMLRSDELPEKPGSGDRLFVGRGFPGVVGRLGKQVSIDERASEPLCHVFLGTLRPGETGNAETDIALRPTGPGHYRLCFRILAKEIATPIVKEYAIVIEGEVRHIGLEDLMPLLCGVPAR